MLKVNVRTFRGNTAVVSPIGRLVLGKMEPLRTAINGVISAGHRRIVIDLAFVDAIDCAAVGELLAYQLEARAAASFLGLSNPTRRIRDVLVIMKLMTVFPIIDDAILGDAA